MQIEILNEQASDVLDFWFGDIVDELPPKDKQERWWKSDGDFDQKIMSKFSALIEKAQSGQLESWLKIPHERMALIILLDQFTRNIYRGTAQAFAADELAQDICKKGIELGHDLPLSAAERGFYYLPLCHSENLTDLDFCIELNKVNVKSAQPNGKTLAQGFLSAVKQHRELIVAYGRYPHRNNVLGRKSTQEELAYLNDEPARFGQ